MSSDDLNAHHQQTLSVGLDLRLRAYRGGGTARYANQLAAALQALEGVELVPYYSTRDEHVESGKRLRTPPHHLLEEWTLPVEVLFNRKRLDVFHSPDFICPRLLNGLRVATVHDLAFLTWPGFLSPDGLAYYNRLDRSRHWTDGWIVPSQWTADALQSTYEIPPERVEVIPHGVPPQIGGDPPLPLEEREGFILAVGTVEPRKNYDLLLDALEEMTEPPTLVVAGALGWQSAATRERLRSAPGVRWIDSADDATLKQLYRTAIAVVVPSYAEGFGFAALEAMASGTPVISAGTGALPEVTGDAALVPESLSSDEWASAMSRILDDQGLWQTLCRGGLERAERFTWEQTARKTVAFYRRLLEV